MKVTTQLDSDYQKGKKARVTFINNAVNIIDTATVVDNNQLNSALHLRLAQNTITTEKHSMEETTVNIPCKRGRVSSMFFLIRNPLIIEVI